MLSILCRIGAELFPAARLGSPEKYRAKTLQSAELQANVAELRAAAAAMVDEARLKEFRDIANARIADEANRQTSIITRAQGLFVALALFGFLFTFGTSFFTQSMRAEKWFLWVCLAFVVYILAQMTIMIFNILRAIRGVGYPTFGTSDLTKWLRKPTPADFYRAQALLALDHYRVAALTNTWRIEHLGSALQGLRNIVLTLSALILFLFVAGIAAPPLAPPIAANPPAVEHCWHGHRWCR